VSSFVLFIVVCGWNLLGCSRSLFTSSERSSRVGVVVLGISVERFRLSVGCLSVMVVFCAGWCGDCVACEDFVCEREIGFGVARFDVVHNRGYAVVRCFIELDVLGNDCVEYAVLEERADVACYLLVIELGGSRVIGEGVECRFLVVV